jgi:hypothetical protein
VFFFTLILISKTYDFIVKKEKKTRNISLNFKFYNSHTQIQKSTEKIKWRRKTNFFIYIFTNTFCKLYLY